MGVRVSICLSRLLDANFDVIFVFRVDVYLGFMLGVLELGGFLEKSRKR